MSEKSAFTFVKTSELINVEKSKFNLLDYPLAKCLSKHGELLGL